MADSEFGGFFDTVKPVLKSDLAGSTSSGSFMPKFGGSSSLPGLGKSGGLGRLKKPGKGGLMNVDKASDSYFGQNLKTLDSLGGINGYQASSYSFTAKDSTGQGLNSPELQAALKEMAGSDIFIQDANGNAVPDANGNAVPDATKPKPAPAQPGQSAQPEQPLQLADGVTYQPNINGRDKVRGKTFAVSGKSVSTGNPYDIGQPAESDNPYDAGQGQSNAENQWYDDAVRKLSKNMYGIDIDSLEIDDVNGQHIDNPVLDSWKSDLREFIRLNNEAHRRKLSKKEVEAWQAAGNSAYDMRGTLNTFSTLMTHHAIPADADTSEVWNDAANAIVAMDKDRLDKYFPGLYESNMYEAAMQQAKNGDTGVLEGISQLLQPVIDSRHAAEEPGNPGTVLASGDFWKWAIDTAGAALVRGVENVKGFSKDLYYRARINDDDTPMTDAERAENEQLKAARDLNLASTQFADEWADQEMQRANDASEVYKTQELIRRGHEYAENIDRVDSFSGGVKSTWDALWRAPIYTTGAYVAQSADTFVGMAIGGGVGGLTGKGTQLAVNAIMNGGLRAAGRAALAGNAAATGNAITGAATKAGWASIVGETIGSGLGAGYNVGAMNVAGDAQAAASRPVADLISDPEFAKFYASQPDSVLTHGVMTVMSALSGSTDSRLPELQSLVAGLQLNPVDANGQPRALTADEKRQILAFYDNPLVQQVIDSGAAQSDLISKYRVHIYNGTWAHNLGRDVAVGVVEGMFSPVAGGVFKGSLGGVSGLLTRHINNKLAKAGLSTAYVLGEGGATEGIEQVVSNIGMNEFQGRDPYENWQRNVGESVVSGAIISGVLATPNAIVAMARHSSKPQPPAEQTGQTGQTDGGTPPSGGTPTGGTPTGGSGNSQSYADLYTDASGIDWDIYARGATTASQLRDDIDVRHASDSNAVVQPTDSPVFHDIDGNEVTVPVNELDEDIAAVQTAQDKLKQQRDEAENNGADKAQLDRMQAAIDKQQDILNALKAARRYYKDPQTQTQQTGVQTQTQTQEQTGTQTQTQQTGTAPSAPAEQQTGTQAQEQPKPKFKPGRWKASREVKNGKVTPVTPTAEQQAMLDKLNAYDKGKFTWEAVGDHEFVRRGSGKKVHIFNTDYLTFKDDGSYEFSTVKDITDDQRKLWEAYRKHKNLSHNTHVDGYFDENGQLTGIAWGLAGKGAGRGGEATFAQMEQTLRDAGVDWKGSDTAQDQQESAQDQQESVQEESVQPDTQTEEQTQTEDNTPAVPSAQQAFDNALTAFNPDDDNSVSTLLDATQNAIDDLVSQNNGVFDPDVRYATSEADAGDDPKARLKEIYAKLDKALLRLDLGTRAMYIATAAKQWLADARSRQMMFHLARTLVPKIKGKEPNYTAFDLLSQFVSNSSGMLDSIDKYRVQMGDGFVDAVKMVAPVWQKSGKFNDVRAFRGAPVHSWKDVAQNVIYAIAQPAAPQAQPAAPAAPAPETDPLAAIKSSAGFQKLKPDLQQYLLDENHKLTQGDWTALAATAKLDPKESGDLYGLLAAADNVAKFIDGDAANTGFLRALRRTGYALNKTYETQIKLEDEANEKAKKQAEEAKRKAEEEQKLQSMLMPEDEQTGDWTYYNDGIRGSTYKDPVYEGESVSLSDSVPVQRQLKATFTDDDATTRLTAPATVTATVYSKTATSGKERHIYVSKDAPADPIATEPKRIQSWLNMRPEQGLWRKGYSPLDALLAALRFMSGNKAAPASFKLIFLTEKGLSRTAVVPFNKLVKPLQNVGEYKKGIETDDKVWKAMGLPDLYAGLCQSLVSLYQRAGRGDSIETSVPGGSSAADNISTFDPIVLETADSFIVIGADTSIGQPYSGTVLISKDEARKEGMLADEPVAEDTSAAQSQAESASVVSEEAREQIRYYVKQGKPVPDGVKTAYNLTDDIINTVVNEEGLNGTEYQEGQAGTDGTDNADSRQEPGESASETGSEDSGSAGRTGEAAESTGNVGTGAQSAGTPESPASPAGEVSAAEQGDGESSVLSNAAPASQTAGTGTGVAPDEGGERKESSSDEADAGESAEPADGSKPDVAAGVDSGNGKAQLQQTNEELAKVALAEKALESLHRRATLHTGGTDAFIYQLKQLNLPQKYFEAILRGVVPLMRRLSAALRWMPESATNGNNTQRMSFNFVIGKQAKFEPHAKLNKATGIYEERWTITLPIESALNRILQSQYKKELDTAGKITVNGKEYSAEYIYENVLPVILNALMYHEYAHALTRFIDYYDDQSYTGSVRDVITGLTNILSNIIDKSPAFAEIRSKITAAQYRDEVFATGMEMAVLAMHEGCGPAGKLLAALMANFAKDPNLANAIIEIYQPIVPGDTSVLAESILNHELKRKGREPSALAQLEGQTRRAWRLIFSSTNSQYAPILTAYKHLINLINGDLLRQNNAVMRIIATLRGMAPDAVATDPVIITGFSYYLQSTYDMSGGLIAEQYDKTVERAHQAIKAIFGLSVDELRPLVPEIDQWIKDDIALGTKLSLGKDANMAALVGESPMSTFRSLIDQTQVALLSDSSADTGAEAQSETPKPQQDNAANGQPKMKTPAQQANAAVEETKTKGEQEKLKETANTLANVNSKLEDKTPEQQAAEKRASDLTGQAVSEIKKGQQQTEDKQKIQLPVFTSIKQLAEWKKTASKEELAAWNARLEEARKRRKLKKLMKSQAENAIAHFADKENDAKKAEAAAFFKQYADKYRNSNRVNFDPADPESELSILLSLLHGEMDLSINDFYEAFADRATPYRPDDGAEDPGFVYNRPKDADPIAEKMIRGFFAKYGESISTEILNTKDPTAYTRNIRKKFYQYCDDNFELYKFDTPETKLNEAAKYWAEYCLHNVIAPIAFAKSNTVPDSVKKGHGQGNVYDPFEGKDAEALKVIKDVLGPEALRAVPFMHYAEISNAEAEALLSDKTDTDSNDTDSGTRYATSEADEEPMSEDKAQQTIDESTASEPDPETPEDKSEVVDELPDDDSGQTQQTAQDDEDSSEPAEPETGAAIDLDTPETNGRLDITFSEVLDQYFTPDEQKQMAPDLAKVVAKLDRVVKTYGVYRRAFMEQMRNAFDANRIFRENHYVRNWANHFIDNWDRSTASLETWAIENYQGKVAPEDNPIIQSILLARRIGSSFTEAVNDILQRGMTMNENGDRVRMLDEKGQPVESVLDATTRMYKKLRDLGLRRDVLDTKENFRKDIGMFRTLLHTIERNEFKYEELKQQYAKLTNDYNTAMQGDDEAKAAAGAILTERAKVEKDIRHFEQMMRAESFDNISMDADYTLPMGGRTIAMARKELDSLYKKYDAALSDAGVRDASERHAIIQEMIISFNIAYQHAIEEMDLLSARSGFFSEHTILQRHNFKYYTPLRQDIGDGRGSTIQAAKGSTTPAIDAISNYCMEAIRRTGAVTRNVIGMALNDAYENLYADYESTHRNANATPEEKMRTISHQSIGRGISVNGLLRLRKDEWSRIPADDERFARFKQQAIFVELVRPTTAEERAAGLMDDTQLERMWIGFDPDIIGRARKSAPSSLMVSQQTATLHGIQNGYPDPEKPGYILYPEVEPRDYSDVGKALVDIAYEPNAKMGNFLKTCGFLTRTASEAMTTFNPLFALKSAIADFRERITRLGHKEFADSNGHKVSGVRIAIRMWRNMLNPKFLGTVGRYSIELAAHKETKNDTQYCKYLAEMHKLGIIGGVQQQMVATGGSRRSLFGMNATEKIQREIEKQRELQEQQTNKEAETLVAKLYRILGDLTHDVSRTRIGKFLHAVHNGAIGWSNMFYNVPLAAQYIAMRECGLSAQSAAADTAKAMDFTNRGYYHKVGSKFISFLTSITHGTGNMLDSLGINRNSISSNPYATNVTGYARRMNMQSYAFKAARLSAYIGLIQVLIYAVGACLRPDEPDKRKAGQQLIDNMPLRSMYFLPVPILQWLGVSDPEGFVFKLAGGFGEDRLALNLAWGLDRYSRGKATMSEVAGSYMVNFVTNAAPADLPDFNPANNPARYMAYSVGHSIPMVAWLVDAALNITYSGKTLSSEFSPAMGQRAYEEHNAYIDIAYKDLSKTLYDTLGMNISPSTLKSMYEGIGYGPVVQGLMQLALHINDEVPRSRLDPDWAAANVNAIAKFFGATSLGNKMPDKPYVFIKQLRDYYEGLFRAAGVSSLLKSNGSGTKSAAIQQTMRMMGMTPAEIADRVNMHDLDNKLTGILKKENALIDLRRSNGISVDQFVKRMNVLIRQANKLQSDFMKSSYYYRGIYGKRAGIPDKYRARLERENRLDAIRRANKELDK